MGSVFQSFHRIDEATLSDGNDQIDGIEVFLTIKTSCQVGFRICRCMKAIAQWAAKAQQRFIRADIQPQHVDNHGVDGDAIS